jgi:2-oxo-hept-3-ene-1,7-dioate hydratase
MNMDGVYRVQTALMHLHCAEGQRKISWNIGLTSKAIQMAPNINMPDSGVLLNTMVFETAETIPKGRFSEPYIEAKITLIMKHDLQGANVSRSDVIAATDYITPKASKFWTCAFSGWTRKLDARGWCWIQFPTMQRMQALF